MRSAGKWLTVLLVAAIAMSSLAFVACGGVTLSSVTAECAVTEYYVGDAFDMSGVTVTAHYSDGSSRTVAGWTVEGGESLAAGTTSVRLSYTEDGVTVSTDVAITVAERPHVHDYAEEWKSDGTNHWRECSCGEKTDVAAHVWSPKTDVTTDVSCTTDGKEIVTCSVCGYSKEQTITALDHDFDIPKFDDNSHWYQCSRCDEESEHAPHDLTLTVTGMKTEYFDGEKVTADGASASVSCDCGYTKSIAASELTVPSDPLTLEDDGAVITVSYGELKSGVTVTVKERALGSISVKPGIKQDYALNETFAGGTLVLAYEGGGSRETELTAEMLTGFDTSTPGKKTVTVSYENKTTEFDIYVGRDADTGYYRLGSETNVPYKVQVEDGSYVDMNAALLQQGDATSKFENTAKDSSGKTYPNGAEGYSTANISVKGNKITLRFVSDYAGKFTLGLRGQSGTGKGLSDQALDKAFAVTVNGDPATITGTLDAGSSTNTAWCDMTVWTLLKDVLGEQPMKKGVNEIEFAFLGNTTDNALRFPNLDYFTVTFTEIYDDSEHTLTIAGGKANGSDTVSLAYGAAIPEITWDDEENIIGWTFGSKAYTDISGLTMIAGDATLRAVYVSDCTYKSAGGSVRHNKGATDDGTGKTVGPIDTNENIPVAVNADSVKVTLGDIPEAARGVTFKNDINFGSGDVTVFVTVTNNGSEGLPGIVYGTELGTVDIGDVGANATVTACAVISSDGADHWTNLFWDGVISSLDVTIAVYTYIAA